MSASILIIKYSLALTAGPPKVIGTVVFVCDPPTLHPAKSVATPAAAVKSLATSKNPVFCALSPGNFIDTCIFEVSSPVS